MDKTVRMAAKVKAADASRLIAELARAFASPDSAYQRLGADEVIRRNRQSGPA